MIKKHAWRQENLDTAKETIYRTSPTPEGVGRHISHPNYIALPVG